MTYKSSRDFRLWIYSVSHSSMIIRSEKQYPDVRYNITYSPNYTIDIEFTGIEFISLPNNLSGVNIRKENGIYRFDNNEKHFIRASFCRIGISQFDHTEDVFSNYKLKYDKIVMEL